jgi:hypothetical protein
MASDLLSRRSDAYDTPPGIDRIGFKSHEPRVNAIDGARGFLALGVALHHAVIYYHFVRTDEWAAPPSRFDTLAGQ